MSGSLVRWLSLVLCVFTLVEVNYPRLTPISQLALFAMFGMVTQNYPIEAAGIGRLLAGYPELEFALLIVIAELRDDFDSTLKALYRTRGETQRIDVADALARSKLHCLGLGTEFAMVIGGMRHCLKIRNQYAHSHWLANPTGFGFMDLEEVAKQNAVASGTSELSFRRLNADLINEQEKYFNYVGFCLLART
jgi:hypothetical protein